MSNLYDFTDLEKYLQPIFPKTEDPISFVTLQTEIKTKDIFIQSSDTFLKGTDMTTFQGIIEKIKKYIESRIDNCSINTRNFKSNKVMNSIMTDMYEITTIEIDAKTLDTNMNVKITNDINFVSQHFFNKTNGVNGKALDKRESLEQEKPYEESKLKENTNSTKNSLNNQTFINLQKLYTNQGVGFMQISRTSRKKPYAIIMRNILGYIVYNCNTEHYKGIYNQMKQVIEKLILNKSYKTILMNEDILDSEIRANYNIARNDNILTDYLRKLLIFVENVLALLEKNDFTEHLLLNETKCLTPKEKNHILSVTSILKQIAEVQIKNNKGNKDLILNIHYGDIYNKVWESIITNRDLKIFATMFGLITTKNTEFEWENITPRYIKRNDLVFQSDIFQSSLYDFKFNHSKVKQFNINVTPDNLDEQLYVTTMAMVIHNLTILEENKFNYVSPMKEFSSKSTYLKNLYNIYSEPLQKKFEDIMNKYIECFRNFVFKKDSIALGLGAYLISLIIFPYLPYKWIHSQALQQDINSSVFHELSCFDSMYSFVEETANGYRDKVECFQQEPYMLGFFSSINPSRRAGSCQDNTLIELMKYDMKNELYGMSMVSYPLITHWSAVDFESSFDLYEKGFYITHKNVIASDKLLANIQSTEKLEVNIKLARSDIQRIENNNYQARANVFLAMTMAHVYRHTNIDGRKNDDNGIAFKQIKKDIGDSSFEKEVLHYITKFVPIIDTNTTNDTYSTQKEFNFSSIMTIFDRYYDDIVKTNNKGKKKQESPFGGGGKPNPYIKVGKCNNRTIYKKKNTFYVRVKDPTTNKMVYKRLTKSMKM
uniref:Uncharacterized protein n=1 Tax=viral metagenome TaxID=1070528 RepID=A0A6C0BPX1_9ZZZZ